MPLAQQMRITCLSLHKYIDVFANPLLDNFKVYIESVDQWIQTERTEIMKTAAKIGTKGNNHCFINMQY